MILRNCLKFHSPNSSWNYVYQFQNINHGIYAKYHFKSCYYLYQFNEQNNNSVRASHFLIHLPTVNFSKGLAINFESWLERKRNHFRQNSFKQTSKERNSCIELIAFSLHQRSDHSCTVGIGKFIHPPVPPPPHPPAKKRQKLSPQCNVLWKPQIHSNNF